MKKRGTIDISFNRYQDGVYYYEVNVTIDDRTIEILLPRHHTFLGWIEIFGLPPQQEWVVLEDLPDFTKTGALRIDGNEGTESLRYTHNKDRSLHSLEIIRRLGRQEEVVVWQQDYQNAPEVITNTSQFTSEKGVYTSEWQTKVIDMPETLVKTERDFYDQVVITSGVPDILIQKTFVGHGIVPELYYQMFPLANIIDVRDVTGSVCELGYLQKDSQHKVDRVHGDWHKLFTINDRQFVVKESNYSSRTIGTEAGEERIKDTYRKELFIM